MDADAPPILSEAKEFLRGVPGGGTSVYDHLTQVLVKLLEERPPDANTLFEEASSSVREATLADAKRLLTEKQLAAKCDQSSEKSRKAVLEYTRPATALFAPSPAEYNAFEVKFPDVMEQSRLWAWGGISFGDETTYLLHLGCRSLAIEHKCRVRFWGKVATRSGDYFIAEANTKVSPATSRAERRVMEGSEGANKYTYFVTKAPGPAGSWRKLPHVTCRQLAVAQQVRRFFSGNLDAPVACYPPMPATPAWADRLAAHAAAAAAAALVGEPAPALEPLGAAELEADAGLGVEANLLRAVVTLISADTVLSLSGFLEAGTEDGAEGMGEYNVIKPAEAPDAVGFDALKDPGTFVHAELDVNAVGRTQATPAPLGPDGEPVEPEEPDAEPKAALRGIGEDTRPCGPRETAWLAEAAIETKALWQLKGDGSALPAKPCGPPTEEGSASGKAESSFSMVAAKSTKWPGAVTVAREGKMCTSIYCGFGVVSNAMAPKPYEPPFPKACQAEWRDPATAEEEGSDPTAGMTEEPDVCFEPIAEAVEE